MSDRLARVALSRLAEPGDPRMTGLVAELGAAEVYRHLSSERDLGGLLTDLAGRLRDLDPERELSEASARGIRFVIPGDPEWPASLADLAGAEPVQRRGGIPVGLWLRGPLRLDEIAMRSAAIVGSRSATTYGAQVAYEISADLAADGFCIVSGAAFGIDHAAHRGAVAARGNTVAVLACGVDRAYPAGHAQLLNHVAEHGLLVSEQPPGSSPTRLRFLARNRLIAAVPPGVVVVEAAARSGALNTANWAARLHRSVCGVPGPVTSAPSEGVHELIRSGKASLVATAAHVKELLSPTGAFFAPPPRGADGPRDRLEDRERVVLDALPHGRDETVAETALRAGLNERAVAASLELLRAAGFVEAVGERWRLARR